MSHTLPITATITDIRLYLSDTKAGKESSTLGKNEKISWITDVLTHVNYDHLDREEKGIVRQYLIRATGYSRAQIARRISIFTDEAARGLHQPSDVGAQSFVPLLSTEQQTAVTPVTHDIWSKLHPRARVVTALSLTAVALIFAKVSMQPLASLMIPHDIEGLAPLMHSDVLLARGPMVTTSVTHDGDIAHDPLFAFTSFGENRFSLLRRHAIERGSARTARLQDVTRVTVQGPERQEDFAAALVIRVAQRRQARLVALSHSAPDETIQYGPHDKTTTVAGIQSDIWDFLNNGKNGQILMYQNGKPVWQYMPIPTRFGSGEGSPAARRGGGGGGGGNTESTDGDVESHDHQNGEGGGVLNINTATTGILALGKGGTGFAGYSTGDLLIGNANSGLSKLALGASGKVLTSSGGTLVWDDAGGASLAIGSAVTSASSGSVLFVDASGKLAQDNSNFYWLDSSNNLGIRTSSPKAALHVVGSGAFTGSLSGSVIIAQNTLRSSGTLVWETAASGATLYLGGKLEGAGLTDCDLATQTLAWDATTGRFSCGTDSDTTYTAGQGLTLTSTAFSLLSTHTGSVISATTTLNSSGTLVWETAASGATLYLGGKLEGAGLSDCDLATQTLNWDATTGRFSCGTDSNTTYTAGQGLTLTSTAFSLLSAHTGSVISATTTLNSSGTLVWETAASGATLYLGGKLEGAGLSDCDLATQTLAWDATTGRFSCGTDSDTTYTAGQGLTLTSTAFSLLSAHTGSVISATTTLNSSGTLVWETAASGATLYLGGKLEGAGLSDCDLATQTLAWDATTGRFSCGDDDSGGSSGLVDHYVLASGDTMTGTLIINHSTSAKTAMKMIGSGSHTLAAFSGGSIIHTARGNPKLVGTYDTSGTAVGVTIAGRYAYVADSGSGIQIIDISNPASPTLVGTYDTTGSTIELTVVGRYVYTVLGYGNFNIIDISKPSSPTLVSTYSVGGSHLGVTVVGRYAYIANSYNGLKIVDISNPASPTLVGAYATLGAANGVVVAGRYAYVSVDAYDLDIIDISNPASPTLVGTYSPVGTTYDVAVVGRYAYLARDIYGLQIIDISNPSSPTLVGTYNTSGNAYGVTVAGRYAYVADYNSGLSVIDISNPASPTLVGEYNTSGSAYDVTVAGRYAYVADYGSGLLAIDLNGFDTPTATIGALEVHGLSVRESARINSNLIVDMGLNVGNGLYVYGQTSMRAFSGAALTVSTQDRSDQTALEVLGTASGRVLFANDSLRSSGTLVWETAASGATLYLGGKLEGAGLTDCDLATQTLAWDATTGRFSCGTDLNTTYTAGQGLTLTSTAFSLLSAHTGSVISATTTLNSSGTLVWETAASGATLYLGGKLEGAGLSDCDADNQTLAWDATTGRFSCGDDDSGGSSGLVDHYVMASGDTMTGVLIINDSGSASGGVLLNVLGTMSGQSLSMAGGNIISSSSGAVVFNEYGSNVDFRIEGDTDSALLFLDGSADRIGIGTRTPKTKLDVVGTISGSLITQNGAGNNYFMGNVGIGTASPDTALEVLGTASGRVLFANDSLRSSGALAIDGATFLNGNVTLGDSTADTITVSGLFGSSLVPLTDNLYDLGTSALRWRDLYLSGSSLHIGSQTLEGTIGYQGVGTEGLTFNSNGTGAAEVVITSGGILSVTGSVEFGGRMYGRSAGDSTFVPSYTWTGDTNTGMYHYGEDTIGFTVGSTELLRIQSAGLVVRNNLEVGSSLSAANFNIGALTVGTTGSQTASLYVIGGRSAFTIPNGTIEFQDTFTEGANTTLASHTPDTGTSWTSLIVNGATSLQVTAATDSVEVPTTVANGGILYTADTTLSTADYEVSIVATTADSADDVMALAARVQDANNMYLVTFSATLANNILYKRVAGTWTTLGTSVTYNVDSGDTLKLRVVGSGITVYTNQQLMISVTDADIASAGKAGLGAGNIAVSTDDADTTWDLDNFKVTPYTNTGIPAAVFERGNVGIGTKTPGSKLAVSGSMIIGRGITSAAAETGVLLKVLGAISMSGTFLIDSDHTTTTTNMLKIITNAGGSNNTVFRVTASGGVYSDAPYNSAGADYAEYFRISGQGKNKIQSGEVVCIDVTQSNTVKRCDRDGDDNVMGIVSTNPAFIGNSVGGADGLPAEALAKVGYALIGLIGQVPANVIVEGSGGAIRPGDSLTAASIPGFARRARPGEATVGVALEGLETGEGKINVLISRRNQSLTVEAVEEKIMQSIASMEIEDEVELLVAGAVETLNFEENITLEVERQIAQLSLEDQIEQIVEKKLRSGQWTDDRLQMTLLRSYGATDGQADYRGQSAGSGATNVILASPNHDRLTANAVTIEETLVTGGDARVGGDLYIDGALAASEIFVPGGLTIDGGTDILGTLRSDTLSVANDATINGTLRVNGIHVGASPSALWATGDETEVLAGSILFESGAISINQLMVRGGLRVIGDITIQGLAHFLGDLSLDGFLIGSRISGYAVIPAGGTGVTVTFEKAWPVQPMVTTTPNIPVLFAVSQASQSGFTIVIAGTATQDIRFTWIAIGNPTQSGTYVLGIDAGEKMEIEVDSSVSPAMSAVEASNSTEFSSSESSSSENSESSSSASFESSLPTVAPGAEVGESSDSSALVPLETLAPLETSSEGNTSEEIQPAVIPGPIDSLDILQE